MGTFAQALVVAMAAGVPAIAWAIYRGRKLGPKEEEELISRSASQAVETMSAVLDAARTERSELLDRLKAAEELAKRRAGELVDLRGKVEQDKRRIDTLEAEVSRLSA